MKKIIIFVSILVIILLSESGCDSGLKIIKVEISHYPNNIIYIIGEDNKLNVDGGKVKLITASGQSDEVLMNDTREIQISSDINFSSPGVYIVKVIRYKGVFCQFPVQVVRGCIRE